MNTFVLSNGSNSKDREWQMQTCIEWLKSNFSMVAMTPIYNSAAANGKDADYLNAVVKVKSKKTYEEINEAVKQYEHVCGRTPMSKLQGSIPMDIDIVVWNDEVVRQNDFDQNYFKTGWYMLNK